MKNNFLKAEWRKLLMVNYAVDAKLLEKYVPFGTELDLWNDTCYVSLVGFMFLNTTVKGIRVPFHINFEEVNLRFYVKYQDGDESKRGVVFIKEIVPRRALTFIANTLYGENYETLPMAHHWSMEKDQQSVSYRWKKQNRWHVFEANAALDSVAIAANSEAEFITEHFWGYTKINSKVTSEYQVEHRRWEHYPIINYKIDVDFEVIYGREFAFLNAAAPVSVFLAEGSEIAVRHGQKI